MARTKALFLLMAIVLSAPSCARPPIEETISPTKAQKKFIELCKSDYALDVVTKAYTRTLWVYLPLDKSFLNIAASKNGPVKSPDSKDSLVINFLEGEFEDATFRLRYDIGLKKVYTDDKGIASKYSDEYASKQRFLLGALGRAYADTEKEPDGDQYVEKITGDRDFTDKSRDATRDRFLRTHIKTDAVPDFIVIVIADIEKGIESRMYLYLQDYLRAMRDQGFGEEYIKRTVVEQPIGHEAIIGDKAGVHLKTYDLTWGEFLAKQMIYRINFKYTQSSFPPSADTVKELTQIAAEVVQGYDFNDFETLNLKDLSAGTEEIIGKHAIKTQVIAPPQLPGKLHHLTFEIKPPGEAENENY